MNPSLAGACIAAILAAAIPALGQPAATVEARPTLAASRLLPPELLRGPLHHVTEAVTFEGAMPRFELVSRFGTFRVLGTAMLATRVAELPAIETLNSVSKSAEFKSALQKAALAPVQLAGQLVDDPGRTVENVAQGAGTVLQRLGRVAVAGAQRVGDAASDLGSSNADKAPTPAKPSGEPEPPRFTGDPFGYNKARRDWAKRLSIDPYTTNPVLRPKLDEVARVTFAGSFAIESAIGFVAGPLQYAVEFDATVRDSVWNTPVIDLEARNQERLKAIGIEGRLVRDFFRNRWFTPTLQTALVTALERLRQVRGRAAVISAASAIQGEARARFLVRSVRMLAEQYAGPPLSEIAMSGMVPMGVSGDGKNTVSAALDYLYWSDQVAAFTQRKEIASSRPALLLAGVASDRARSELSRRGWTVRENQAMPRG